MRSWQDITLGDLGRAVARYRPFIALVLGVLAVATLLPGEQDADQEVAAAQGASGLQSRPDTPSVEQVNGEEAVPNGVPVDVDGQLEGTATTVTETAKQGASRIRQTTQAATPISTPADVGPDCDSTTGRIRVPTRFAPPCKPVFRGNNGGSTWRGVTADTINVVYYRARSNPALDAALRAANASDEREHQIDTVRTYIDYFNAHYEFYGRKLNLIVFDGTAEASNDAAGRADAIAVADKGAFVSLGSPNNAYIDELVARKVMCICSVSQPQEFYEERAPYAGYTTLMASTQGYILRAEYVGKRLARNNAKWAGYRDTPADPMSDEERVFGLLYYETADNAYKAGADFFERELKEKYNVTLKVKLPYNGFPDVAKTQEQARPLITRMKSERVNNVVFAGDPIAPGIFTAEAARQNWQPEWTITGSALTDTTLFARTYNQDQWSRAFGISFLTARSDAKLGDSYNLHVWHSGREPRAENTYPILYASPFIFATGVHMAGPTLNPLTFQKGLFEYPVTGNMITSPTVSWGKHGIWPFIDYTAYDDVTEIWWDPQATGPDETDHHGVGMYRYVSGGKRYLPGQLPRTPPDVFDRQNMNNPEHPAYAPSYLNERPKSDQAPKYEHKHYR